MSSWLSLNPFKSQQEPDQNPQQDELNSPSNAGGVKEDLSEIGKTLSRQLWGVASFLAPPPSTTATTTSSSSGSAIESGDSSSQTLVGIRNDFAEISGTLKSGFSLISTNKAVNEISRLASNLLLFDKEDDEKGEFVGGGDVGITEETLEFVREISLRPECWMDFPLSLDDHGFDMSDAQREHALAVDNLAPSLADLRMKLCPSHLKEEHFWMIYFILLHPRLSEQDSELLSTPEILDARDILLQMVQKRTNAHLQTSQADDASLEANDSSKGVQEEYSPVEEKEVLAETVNAEHEEDADVDKWLEEDDETTGTGYNGQNQLGNGQEVSFSDLEDDDNDTGSRQGGASPAQNTRSSPNDSSGWIQLSENSDSVGGRKKATGQTSREKDSEGEDSNEWLTIDEFDSDSVGTA